MTAKPLVIAALILAAIASTTTARADSEHDRLTAMCGSWDVDMTFWLRPGGPGIATKGTSTIRPLLNGLLPEWKAVEIRYTRKAK